MHVCGNARVLNFHRQSSPNTRYIPIIVVSFANIQGYFWQKKVLKVGFFATDGVEDLSPAVETNLDIS